MLKLKHASTLAAFPHAVLENIFSHLSLSDLSHVARVCKRWNIISNVEALWRRAFDKHFAGMNHPELMLDLSVRTTALNNRFKEALRTRAHSKIHFVCLVPPSNRFFPSVQAAIRAASPGDVIAVRPGAYDEILTVEKRVEIVGDGARDQVLLKSYAFIESDPYVSHPICIACVADDIRVANLSMAAQGRARILLRGKGIRIDGCNVKCMMAIAPDSQVVIRRSTINGGEPAGVLMIGGGSRLLMEANVIQNNYVGVMGGRGPSLPSADPLNITLLRNKIHSNRRAGVQLANEKTRALIAGNEICDNLRDGVHLSECSVVLRNNLIRFNVRDGLRKKRGARVEEYGNKIFNNNTGDEPSMVSRFLSLEWFEPSSWSMLSLRAVLVVILLIFSVFRVVWRAYIEPPIAHLMGTTHQR